MTKICAWCGAKMKSDDDEAGRPITHGMCDDCLKKVLSRYPQPAGGFLDRLNVPILIVDKDGCVITANIAARRLSGKELPEIEWRMCGNVMECVHARLPEGCGYTPFCPNCPVRTAVVQTWATGRAVVDTPAHLDVETPRGIHRMLLRISAEKAGAYVLLRIVNDVRTNAG
ncbi:MAG: hypothetical protein M1457_00675 [bacterium]|nr:hypothetical protein [bacterium]